MRKLNLRPEKSDFKEDSEINFTSRLEIIRKRFPVSVDIKNTECNLMKNGNYYSMLLKKQHYNEYCFVEIHKATNGFGFTIFKSDWKDFEKIENDFQYGFSFAPKDCTQIEVIMNTLV